LVTIDEGRNVDRPVNRELGFLTHGTHDPDDVDQIYHLEIRDSDVFVVTYPKSGTIWMQQILLLLESKGDVTAISETGYSNGDLIPWIEVIGNRLEFICAPSPRLRVTHLQYHFLPAALSHKKGKVWHQSQIEYLGVILTKNLAQLYEVNYKRISKKIYEDLDRWSLLPLDLGSRIRTIKINVLPRLLYIFAALPVEVPAKQFREWDKHF
uniref:Sulfotransferase n=1 Tax=Kryptolebias marmoratus TaxID=37003 RepID=A0A3Q3FBC5_KRYMA